MALLVLAEQMPVKYSIMTHRHIQKTGRKDCLFNFNQSIINPAFTALMIKNIVY